MTAKSPDAFRTISEVAEELDVPAHVLRFWESRFTQIKPVKRAGGRRYYRPDDIELIDGIKRLLHEHGMTIRGVQKLIKDHGIANVASLASGARQGAEPMAFAPFAKATALPGSLQQLPLSQGSTAPSQPQAPDPQSEPPRQEPVAPTIQPGNLPRSAMTPATPPRATALAERQQQLFSDKERPAQGLVIPKGGDDRPHSPLSGRIAGALRRADGDKLRQVRSLISPLATRLEALRERLATATRL